MLKLFSAVLVTAALTGAQEVSPPPVDEVLRQTPPDPHALDFLALTPSIPGIAGNLSNAPGGPPYKVGGHVTAPRVLKAPDPNYSKEARKRRIQGTVRLWVVVGADGLPQQIKVQKTLGYGLDEAAIEAVRKWRFQPAMKDGKPVAVQINVEVNFRM